MLGRTLLYAALTRAWRLVVFVGQPRALRLAVRDWRRDPRHTALKGLLRDTIRITRPERTVAHGGVACDVDALTWESLPWSACAGE
jgi:hypothetical protein